MHPHTRWRTLGRMDTRQVEEGIDAYCVGVGRNACPYERGTPEHADWLRGWDEAEELDFDELAASLI